VSDHQETPESRVAGRERLLAMSPADRASLAEIISKRLAAVPARIADLKLQEEAAVEWLTEFAPELLPEKYRQDPA
jgi:hypothetical protein